MSSKTAPPRPAPRLYLATPEVDDPSALASLLPGLLAAADVLHALGRSDEAMERLKSAVAIFAAGTLYALWPRKAAERT